jgi:hypothetical protein
MDRPIIIELVAVPGAAMFIFRRKFACGPVKRAQKLL